MITETQQQNYSYTAMGRMKAMHPIVGITVGTVFGISFGCKKTTDDVKH